MTEKLTEDLALSVRALNAIQHRFPRVVDLLAVTRADLLKIPHVGRFVVDDIERALREEGLALLPPKPRKPPGPKSALRHDNDRLRALVKAAECPSEDSCPWCRTYTQPGFADPHKPDCPAFWPDGRVR